MAHNNYYLDLCADIFVVNGDAVLLRMHEKYNYWGAPGGHIDAGEDVNEAALREVWEEVGLRVELVGPKDWVKSDTESNKDLVPPMYANRHKINDVHDHSAFVFAARSSSREINPQEKKSKEAECLWCTKDELDELMSNDKRLRPEVYKYAVKALELVC